MWLKRKLNPFDVTNVSITAFAHKISMEIIEKGVILWRECLGVTYWILLLPEYQYSVRMLVHPLYMIFHWAERLKLHCTWESEIFVIFSPFVKGKKKKTFSVFMWWWFVCRHCRSSEKVQGGTAPDGNGSSERNNAWWAHVWCMMVPRLVWQYMFQFAWFLYLLFESFVFSLETTFSHPDCTCCRLVFTDIWLLFFIHRTHIGLSKPVKNTVWRTWGCQMGWEKLTYVRFLLVNTLVSCSLPDWTIMTGVSTDAEQQVLIPWLPFSNYCSPNCQHEGDTRAWSP